MPVTTPCPLCVPPGERQWQLSDGVTVLEGHIADCGIRGVECRLLVDGLCRLVERCANLEEALATLAERREHYEQKGWKRAGLNVATV
jgi:hypothetical protein